MGLWDKLSRARNYVRKRRGPDSYFRYKQKREDERKGAERGRERERATAEQERGDTKREREYDERYSADRKSDIAGTERAKETEPEP